MNNALADTDAALRDEACVVSSTPDQQSADTKSQPVSRKKYVTEKEILSESFKKLTPEYMFIITEMRNLLKSERKKFVFYALATHISTKEVAKHLKIPQRKVKMIFEEALFEIRIHTGFISSYLDDSLKKGAEVRLLRSKIISLNARIKKLEDEQVLRMRYVGEKLSIRNQRLLLKEPLNVSLDLDTRTFHALRSGDIDTLEDLMKYYINNNGLKNLKTIRNFGETSLNRLQNELIKKGIIDVNGDCTLLRYVKVPVE